MYYLEGLTCNCNSHGYNYKRCLCLALLFLFFSLVELCEITILLLFCLMDPGAHSTLIIVLFQYDQMIKNHALVVDKISR